SGSTFVMAQGIEWAADHGARVINVSLGSVVSDPRLEAAIRYAIGHGSLVVAAAGNSAATDPHACGTGTCGGHPAALASSIPSGLVSVGAVDSANQLYRYSNHGSWVLV